MALELTQNALDAAARTAIQPQIILEIEGVTTVYGAVRITKYIQIGDTGLVIGSTWTIGGLNDVEDQGDYISMSGTGSRISQQLYPDKGSVSSASSISVELIDKNNDISSLISPGVVIDDLLGANAKLYMGFQNTAWPEDFVEIFRGFVDEIISGPGNVSINLVHPEKKKLQQIFTRKDATLSSGINNAVTSIPVANADTTFLFHYFGPDGAWDTACKHYVRIDDEIIEYLGLTSTNLTLCTRGALGTTAASHSSGAKVTSFYVFEDDVVDLALKLMLSGPAGKTQLDFAVDVEIEAFNEISVSLNVPDAIYFDGIDVADLYGLTVGDYVRTYSTTEVANTTDPGWVQITDIVTTDSGSYVVCSGAGFVDETSSPGKCGFRSQYDSLPDGLGMTPNEVDVAEHQRWQDLQLSAFEYRIYVRDTINGKEFIDKEIYAPCGAYSIPRKGKASMGYTIGPIPSVDTKILDQDSVRSPSKIRLRRTTARHFYNAIAYKYDEDALEKDKFTTGNITVDATSQTRIPVGNSVFTVESRGMRTDLSGATLATSAAQRRLNRYRFAAEYFEGLEVMFRDGFNLEPGDLVILDFENLQVTNSADGTRTKPAKFYEVINKSMDLKTGQVSLTLLDTNHDASERYGLVSPSSTIATAGSSTYAIIEDSFGAFYPGDEQQKWLDYVGLPVLVHSADFTFSEEVTFTGFDPGNPYKMLFDTALSSPVQVGWIIDIPSYSTSTDPATNRIYKLMHAHQSPEIAITSGASTTQFDVGGGDVSKFFVGSVIRVHDADFTNFSDEVTVTDVTGTTITVGATLGFTPTSSMFASFVGFADHEQAYRII